MDKSKATALQAQGAVFYPWNPPHAQTHLLAADELILRLVTSFASEAEEVEQLITLLA
jgi:threonine aldolase